MGTAHQDEPDIAVDPRGNAHAIWRDSRSTFYDIYHSYRPAGGTWQPNEKVNDGTHAERREPSIAVHPAGHAFAVWSDKRNGHWDLYFAWRAYGGDWGNNCLVGNPTSARQQNPSIAVDVAGNLYLVWADSRSGNDDIYFAYRPFPFTQDWSDAVKVNNDEGTTWQDHPALAVDAAGNVYVVWEDSREGTADIVFAYRPAGGSWGANSKVNDGVGTLTEKPKVAVSPGGKAFAVWSENRSGVRVVRSSERSPGDTSFWQATVPVNDDAANVPHSDPSVAVSATGGAWATWSDSRTGSGDIWYSYHPASGVWNGNARLTRDLVDQSPKTLAVAVDPMLNFYAVWADSRHGNYDIYASFHAPSRTYLPLAIRTH